MTVQFLKDFKDPRENRSGVFKKGKITGVSKEFGEQLLKDKVVKRVKPEDNIKDIKKKFAAAGVEIKEG